MYLFFAYVMKYEGQEIGQQTKILPRMNKISLNQTETKYLDEESGMVS